MNDILVGAIAMASLVISMVFTRYWRNTGDRFFLYFALSFGIEGAHRIYSSVAQSMNEESALHYLIRLVAYGLILWAIFEKNWPRGKAKR
ncbi:DUF5985 family protein [Massilia sp. GCM10020059]|mgnify:CR=1 FL=1|uniref:DUF5985 family protein n=1 Tax=Massilia agrisoli TaxID=2892444 RepID=A0ABS8IQI9_9BURK|nr:DUF5985 family protein [Massilia agrisoli]MCC6070895.1 DUF5985 family protein [Massilia agrisoli]